MSADVTPAMRSWEDEFRELAEEFVRRGAERLRQLEAAIQALQGTPSDARHLQELRRHFHRLVAAGSTYGYDAISRVARQAEDVCTSAEGFDPGALAALIPRWRGFTARLRGEFDAASGHAPKAAEDPSEPRQAGTVHAAPHLPSGRATRPPRAGGGRAG